MNPRLRRLLMALPWLAAAGPALAQLCLLFSTVLQRFSYPYDLEWMEGGMLNHAARISAGAGIYVEPSVDFIPYLYTPLYPGLLATLEPIFGLSYQSGRALSIIAMIAIAALACVAIVTRCDSARRGPAWAGGALAAGFFAATYPWVDGWYDIVRADTMFLALAVGGIVATHAWLEVGSGWRGHARIAVAAAILALAFFTKQTGIFFVAAGGAIVLVGNWRRVPAFVASAGLVGLGGTWLLDRASDGWFWTYVFEVHQTHHCHPTRFKEGFATMLGHFPMMTATIAVALVVVAVAWGWRRQRPPAVGALLVWSWVFAVAVVVGAVGIATMWSVNNAFIPAMVAGGIAAGAALPALHGAVTALRLPHADLAARLVTYLAAAALAFELIFAWWSPRKFIPTQADREAGDRLVGMISEIDGEVFIPFHPWYGHLAGKRVYAHRMGVHDVRYKQRKREAECFFASSYGKPNWKVKGLPEVFTSHYFAAVIWDNRSLASDSYFPGSTIIGAYRLDDNVPKGMRPKVRSGARVVPEQIWVPIRNQPPPPGARVLFDFEDGKLADWVIDGSAWGRRPVSGPVKAAKQGAVRRYRGRYFLSSMHGGDSAVGSLTSPAFTITGGRITFRLSGGLEGDELRGRHRAPGPVSGDERAWLRVELRIAGKAVRHATVSDVPSERMTEIQWRLSEYVGAKAVFVLVDNAEGSWGHINVDEFMIWNE